MPPRYSLFIEVTDSRPGWELGNRVVPQRFLVRVEKFFRLSDDGFKWADLTDTETDAIRSGAPTRSDDWVVGLRPWLELEVESSPTVPPRCVALRAPDGISTPEQRFPLAGIVTEATAAVASRDGSFRDFPHGLEYEDALFEAGRARGRKRARRALTPERLEEVARIADENPRKPTAAVQHHFRISRGYARKLIKLATERKESTDG